MEAPAEVMSSVPWIFTFAIFSFGVTSASSSSDRNVRGLVMSIWMSLPKSFFRRGRLAMLPMSLVWRFSSARKVCWRASRA